MGTDTPVQVSPQERKTTGPLDRVPDWGILLAFCALFCFEVIGTIRQKSATFDEPLNLTSGYLSLKSGDYRLIPQNLPLVKLQGAFLLLFLFFWTKQLSGRSGATFALLLYCFEPNVLAHSGLITTDIATSCFMFLTIYGWHQSAQGITWRRGIFTGLALGLAMLTKFTTFVLCPILVFLGAVLALSRRPLHLRLKGVPSVALD